MNNAHFQLDSRLDADTSPVISLPLCDVLLMNDCRYPWLILVPRIAGLVEVADLDPARQTLMWQEVSQAGAALRSLEPCEKLNIGALGNIVRQLHVHVVARRKDDPAWPGPVWGHGQPERYASNELVARVRAIENILKG